MASSPFQQAVTYCNQAIQSVLNCVGWLEAAQVSAPLYSAIISAIVTAANNIQAVVNTLVATLENQESGNVISPIATVTGVPLTVVGTTSLYVVPAGKTLIVTGWTVRNAAQTSAAGNAVANVIRLSDSSPLLPTGSFGSFFSNQSLQFEAATAGHSFDTVAAGDTVLFNVSVKDTGTSNIVTVDLFGYLV